MLWRWRILLAGLFVFGVLAPLRALSDVPPDEVENNRVRMLKLRDDHDAYADLLRKTGEFLRLPEDRREQLVRVDHELRHLEPAQRERNTSPSNR